MRTGRHLIGSASPHARKRPSGRLVGAGVAGLAAVFAVAPLAYPASNTVVSTDNTGNTGQDSAAGLRAAVKAEENKVAANFGVGKARVNGTTERASVADDDSESETGGFNQAMSGDGRYVAFVSSSDLWTRPDGDGTILSNDGEDNIYVRDLLRGTTVQVSIGRLNRTNPATIRSPDGFSNYPSISDDGRYVSFVTSSTDITDGPGSSPLKIVACDRGERDSSGDYPGPIGRTFPDLKCFYVEELDRQLNDLSDGWPRLSGDASRIVWAEPRLDQFPGSESFNPQVMTAQLRDANPDDPNGEPGPLHEVEPDNVINISSNTHVDNVGAEEQPSEAVQPAISEDGHWVAAQARNQFGDVMIVDYYLPDGDPEDWTGLRVDRSNVDNSFLGNSDAPVEHPSVSNNVTTVFDQADPGENLPQVYSVKNNAKRSVLVSNNQDGDQGDGFQPTISADGRYVGFVTDIPGMTQAADILQRDFTCINPEPIFLTGPSLGAQSPNANSPNGGAPKPGNQPNASPAAPKPSGAAGSPGAGGRAPDAGGARHLLASSGSGSGSFTPTDSGSGTFEPPPPITRTPCQIVSRDLVVDATRVAGGLSRLPAQLASPDAQECDFTGQTDFRANAALAPANGFPLCDGLDDSFGPVSVSNDGARVSYDSDAFDLIDADGNSGNGENNGTDAFVHTWQATLTAGPLDFGDVQLGTSSQQTLTLTGNGYGPIDISQITVTGLNPGDFTVGAIICPDGGTTVHEHESCQVTITFTPKAPGPRSGTINVFGTDPDPTGEGGVPTPKPILTIPVTGNGTRQPPTVAQFSGTPDPIQFGSHIPLLIPGTTRAATITNPGQSKLILTSVTVQDGPIPGTHADYTVNTTDCVGGVSLGSSCQIFVTFVGHAVGNRQAVLRIVDNAPGGLNLIGLQAKVRKPILSVNPGVSPTGRVVTVAGLGFAPLRRVDIAIAGQGETTTVVTDSKGRFSTGLVLFPNGDEGPRTITAHTHAVSKTISGDTPLLVVLGSLDSPTLVIRH